MDKSKQLIIAIVMLFSFNGISAQKAAVKTNIIADATTTMSLAAEIGTAPKNTLELYMHWNPWS
jgi:hypothetical protein